MFVPELRDWDPSCQVAPGTVYDIFKAMQPKLDNAVTVETVCRNGELNGVPIIYENSTPVSVFDGVEKRPTTSVKVYLVNESHAIMNTLLKPDGSWTATFDLGEIATIKEAITGDGMSSPHNLFMFVANGILRSCEPFFKPEHTTVCFEAAIHPELVQLIAQFASAAPQWVSYDTAITGMTDDGEEVQIIDSIKTSLQGVNDGLQEPALSLRDHRIEYSEPGVVRTLVCSGPEAPCFYRGIAKDEQGTFTTILPFVPLPPFTAIEEAVHTAKFSSTFQL